jgi:hypothetical protein
MINITKPWYIKLYNKFVIMIYENIKILFEIAVLSIIWNLQSGLKKQKLARIKQKRKS